MYIPGEELKLSKLKELGFNPNTILDIGAHTGQFYSWAKNVWPQSFIWMIEANECHEPVLNNIVEKINHILRVHHIIRNLTIGTSLNL